MLFICGAVLAGTTKVLAAEGTGAEASTEAVAAAEANVASETADVEESADGVETEVAEEVQTEANTETTEVKAETAEEIEEDESEVVVFEAEVEETGRKYTAKDVKLLACLIYAEAGNQSYKGKLAVANVVLNRVDSPLFPNTLKGPRHASCRNASRHSSPWAVLSTLNYRL